MVSQFDWVMKMASTGFAHVICSNSHVMLGSPILYVSTGEDIITQFLTVLSQGVGHAAGNVIPDIV